jgi:hypothetical protein
MQLRDFGKRVFGIVIPVALLLFAIPILLILPLYGIAHTIYRLVLLFRVWSKWCRQGKYVLAIYSDSRTWKEYFENEVFPLLGERSVILNLSDRNNWHSKLASNVFNFYKGEKAFCPMVIVFNPWRPSKVFRYWVPFKKFKHGSPSAVHFLTQHMLKAADAASIGQT